MRGQFNKVFFNEVTSQLMVGIFVKIDMERLGFIWINQKKLRVEDYVHLWDWMHFTLHTYPWERYESNYSPSSDEKIIGQTGFFHLFFYRSKKKKTLNLNLLSSFIGNPFWDEAS